MSKINNNPTVGIIMGSKSDWKGVMEHCSEVLEEFGINHDVRVISAHRTPKRLERFISEAEKKNRFIFFLSPALPAQSSPSSRRPQTPPRPPSARFAAACHRSPRRSVPSDR